MTSYSQPYNQEKVFLEKEADAWFNRNSASIVEPAPPDHPVLQALRNLDLPLEGTMLDIGGAAGQVSAGFLREYPAWSCCVVEPSSRAISAGNVAFPNLEFAQGSIAQPEGMPWTEVDIVIVSGVFVWVDRLLLSRAVANVDGALKDSGLLVISDFDSPVLRANSYR
ncbi:MAG: class I SAM-dependent methyltransferase, partial [Moorea sp. SIO2I5]|nr:class I SAM-dependent methyltransferase [Moorena sp. SIO2I5]